MDRRSFLKGAAVAFAAAPAAEMAAAAVLKPDGIRISCRQDDPGYRAWCILRGDHKKPMVYLNGRLCKFVSTADERLGIVIRGVETPGGNIAHDGENFLEETVYGDVGIVIT